MADSDDRTSENGRDFSKQRAAGQEVLQTLFDDLYDNRRRVYGLNFVRGIFFGLGSVLGGTLVLAFIVYILSWFIDLPLIGEWIRSLMDVLPQNTTPTM